MDKCTRGKLKAGEIRCMKTDIVMRINCVECGKRYSIANNELDDYNIYWVTSKKHGFMPKLLCPTCTKKSLQTQVEAALAKS